ncbi:MAG: hypothetical protein AAB583_04570 [Patescibacteria group bacterium]
MPKKFLAIGIILGLVIIAGIFYIFKDSVKPQNHTVNLTEAGFSPNELTINKDDTVIFTTNRDQSFWPASNLHPTHGIYPQFDPKQPVEPGKEWSFVFDKVGTWKYHDHLAPLYRGTINVEDKRSQANDCSKVTGNQKIACFEGLIDKTLKDKGLSSAFEVLAILYQKDPQFASSCHDFVHKLGEKAYGLFASKQDFQLSDKSSYCGYGFYHGFMETLLQTTNDMSEGRKFCEYADSRLKLATSDAGGACYHGIGHGAVDGSDPRTWGNAKKMIEPALKLCEMVSNDENPPLRYGKLFRCVSGVFNGLEILSSSSQYELSLNRNDPFWICKTQPDRYKEACFTQFVVAVINVTDNDFIASAKIIDSIEKNEYAIPTLQSLVVELPHQGKTDYQQTLNFCRNLTLRFQIPCISAFAEGFMKYGPPQKEYLRALEFCDSNLLTKEEKQACFSRILSILRIWYTAQKSQEICQSVDEKYRWNGCKYN